MKSTEEAKETLQSLSVRIRNAEEDLRGLQRQKAEYDNLQRDYDGIIAKIDRERKEAQEKIGEFNASQLHNIAVQQANLDKRKSDVSQREKACDEKERSQHWKTSELAERENNVIQREQIVEAKFKQTKMVSDGNKSLAEELGNREASISKDRQELERREAKIDADIQENKDILKSIQAQNSEIARQKDGLKRHEDGIRQGEERNETRTRELDSRQAELNSQKEMQEQTAQRQAKTKKDLDDKEKNLKEEQLNLEYEKVKFYDDKSRQEKMEFIARHKKR